MSKQNKNKKASKNNSENIEKEVKEVKEEIKADVNETKWEEVKTEEAKEETTESKTQETKKEKDSKEENEKSEPEKKSAIREIMEWILCLVVAFTLAITIKYFLFTPTLVKQSSMYPTIFDGERVFVNRLVRTFKLELNRGDIVTLEAPMYLEGNGQVIAHYDEHTGLDWLVYNVMEFGKISYIKRIIGLPGDTVKLENGEVYINGELLDESDYLIDGVETYISNGYYDSQMPSEFVVPEGYVFAMGDNRSHSRDCRELGCIPLEKIEGRVVGRIWPLNKFGSITKSDMTIDEVKEYNKKANSGGI